VESQRLTLASEGRYGEVVEVPTDAKELTGSIEETTELLRIEQTVEGQAVRLGESAGRIFVTMGQSKLVTTEEDVKRVSITSDELATVMAVSAKEILIDAKKPGTTTLIVWDSAGKTHIFDLTVQRDVALLKEYLKEIDEGISAELYPVKDTVVLWGEVDTPDKITKAIMVAAAFFGDTGMKVVAGPGGTIVDAGQGYKPPLKFASTAGSTAQGSTTQSFKPVNRVWNVGEGAIITTNEGKVISFLRLINPLQVELQVRFLQVELLLLKELGFDSVLDAFRGQTNSSGFVTNTTGVPDLNTDPAGISPTGVVRYFILHQSDDFLFRLQLRALEENQVVSVLSEPNLTVISGQEATFLVGGEFPVLVPESGSGINAGNRLSVEWKVFGNKLEVVPEVKGDDMINLKLTPEVSERSDELGVDFPAGVGGQTVRIPGLKISRTETTVEIKDGDSLIIAGLLRDKEETRVTQVPFIGNIPYVGRFFRTNRTRNTRTELIVVVTPKLVKPMTPEESKSAVSEGLFRGKSAYDKFLEKRFEPSRWLVGPIGYQ
jgi:pilus assembly protein CpaC